MPKNGKKSSNKFLESYKINFFLALFTSFIIISCAKKEIKIPVSVGNVNSVAVIIDNQLWGGEIGDSVRNKFAAPLIGLPQEEPVFTINQYPVKLLEGFITDSRNIILIKKETKSRFEIIENEYAKPQIVVHISGKTVPEIIDTIENNYTTIIDRIKASEILEIQRINRKTLLKTKKINAKFRITIDIPKAYRMVMRKQKFIWLKKEISSGSNSILIYQTPIITIKNKKTMLKNLLKIRDSIGNLYIHGSLSDTRMIVQKETPYSKEIFFNNKKTIQTKGSWEMINDNMSGPYINYAIFDKKQNRMIFLDGFCYAPSKTKRDLMLELEAIIKTVKFQ